MRDTWRRNTLRPLAVCLLVVSGCGGGSEESVSTLEQSVVLVNATFDSGNDGFVYADDAFGTAAPSGASGTNTNGQLRVTLGQAPNSGANSGGFLRTFSASGPVSVSFEYSLQLANTFESPECAEVRVTVDGVSYGSSGNPYVVRLCGAASPASGTFSFTTPSLSAGTHTISVGGFLNGNSFSDEIAHVDIDDVVVSGSAPGSCGDSQCSGGETCGTCPSDCGACPAGAFVESGGQVVMEAEHFSTNTPQGGYSWVLDTASSPSGGQAELASPNDGASVNTGYTTSSPRLDYRVQFATTGTYNVWVRGRDSGTVGNNDSVHVGIGGVATASADRINGFTGSFGWSRSTLDGTNATITVGTAGIHTINVWMREDGFVFDKIILTRSGSFTPSGAGPAESPRVEACGDGACDGAETCTTCSADCGACPPTCGDGTCSGGETCTSCSLDCGGCPGSGLDSRPPNPTCVAPPPIDTSFTLRRRWPNLTFSQPLGLQQAPGQNGIFYVLEKTGRVRAVPDNDAATNGNVYDFINLSSVVVTTEEGGVLGMAFHPGYASNGYVFISYTLNVNGLGFVTRVSRFKRGVNGTTLDPSSEVVVLQHPKIKFNHNAGNIAFGPDGYLYLSLGDDAYQDPTRQLMAANPNNWFGKVLRLTVSVAQSPSPAYTIPPDNPFAGGGGQPEVYAYGLRNPWRFSFDRLNGELWLADVGEDIWEEIDVVTNGGFYGWPHREADLCRPGRDCNLSYEQPEHAYFHAGPASITGGYVYRGAQIPELYGSYVYGDYITGDVWAYDRESSLNQTIRTGGATLSAFGEDNQGELYAVRFSSGTIEKLERLSGDGPTDFPALITDTGCVQPSNPTQVVSGVIPYSIAVPFWSDGAEKERFLALPDGAELHVDGSGDWELPPGAVTIKHFRHQGQLFETRFFVRHQDGSYSGYTYEWNETQTQATLVPAAGKSRSLPGLDWRYPSRSACFACHTDAAGGSLGLETRQVNIDGYYPSTGRTANQVLTLDSIGMLSGNTASLSPLPATSDISVPLQDRAKAYLHANCAHCHRPGGTGRGPLDARFTTLFGDMRLCNEPPALGDLGVPGATLLTPGDHLHSIAWLRMSQRGDGAMPPLASEVVDVAGRDLLQQWIGGLTTCPPPTSLACDVAGNRVANCNFSSGLAPWSLRLNGGGAGSASVASGELRLDVTNPGTLDWHVQDVQILGALPAGNFQLSFDARASAPRTLVVNLGEEGDSYASFCQQSVALTTTTQTFVIQCNGLAGDNQVKLDFNVGNGGTATVFVDNVYFGPPR